MLYISETEPYIYRTHSCWHKNTSDFFYQGCVDLTRKFDSLYHKHVDSTYNFFYDMPQAEVDSIHGQYLRNQRMKKKIKRLYFSKKFKKLVNK